MLFFLGTHRPYWLWKTPTPLFVSRRTLAEVKNTHKALAPWALDSGGFSELKLYGRWETPVRQYIREVCRWIDLGNLQWAAPMDWMCEPFMIAKTGLTVLEHQKRTVANFLDLMDKTRWEAPFIPVLQGWFADDYLRCAEMYEEAGVRLAKLPVVGVGSVCRRQKTQEAIDILRPLHALGLKLHGFGFKLIGLAAGASHLLASADSLAWSYTAFKQKIKLAGCRHKGWCCHCLRWALLWREKVLKAVQRGQENYQGLLY